jgi:tetratricopeptide (TPR) repeat protein
MRRSIAPILLLALPFLAAGCPKEKQNSSAGTSAPPANGDRRAAAVLNNNGVALLEHERGDAPGALDLFKKAVAADPSYAIGHTNVGIAYQAASSPDYAKSKEALTKAEQCGGNTPNLFFARGLANKGLFEYAAAEADLKKVLQIDPEDAFTQFHLGMVLRDQNKVPEAEAAFRAAIRRMPTLASAWLNLGQILRRQGRPQEGAKCEDEFNRLKGNGTAVIIGGPYYAANGKYLEPVADTNVTKAAPTPLLPLSDKTTDWGLAGRIFHASAAGDYDNDGKPDIALFTDKGVDLLHNAGNQLQPAPAPIPYPAKASGGCWADFDNDGYEDLLVYGPGGTRLYRNLSGRQFQDVSAAAGIPTAPSRHAVFSDANHDGWLDIIIATETGNCILLRNNSNAKFTNITVQSKLSGLSGLRFILPTDFDRNRAVDLLCLTDAGVVLMSNRYDGTFEKAQNTGLENVHAPLRAASADINSDGRIDYIFATPQGLVAAISKPGAPCQVSPLTNFTDPCTDVTALDADNDGRTDLAVTTAKGCTILQGDGRGEFPNTVHLPSAEAAALSVADLDSTGFAELIIGGKQPKIAAPAPNQNRWLALRSKGLKAAKAPDKRKGPRANGSGIGSLVEAWTDSTWQTVEINTASGSDSRVVLGLGSGDTPRWTRILWPSGVHQCEPLGGAGVQGMAKDENGRPLTIAAVKIGAEAELWEPDRAPTSCPVLYAWNGSDYQFITDLQGGAIVGYNIGDRQYNSNDPDELVALPPGLPKLRDGMLSVEIACQLQEVLMIDKVQLIAVDHPENTTLFSSDRMLSAPPFPPSVPLAVEEIRPVIRAEDDHGRNVTETIRKIDRTYPDNFALLPHEGFTQPHSLTLTLGDVRSAEKVHLLLYGWQQYAHSTSNLTAAHAGVPTLPPSLQVRTPSGAWKTVAGDIGSVAGLPKWMTVDITPHLKQADPKNLQLRITTNIALYWDQIALGITRKPIALRQTPLAPASAEYHWLGYPEPTYPDGRDPVVYNYSRRRHTAPWRTPQGWYTRPGDVTPLLQNPDDMYVIMRHGYALRIGFSPKQLPQLPTGWKRTYMLLSDGFGKDMDMNGAFPATVEPLPFHKMTRYPYSAGEKFPDDPQHRAWRAQYNTWYQDGNPEPAVWPELHRNSPRTQFPSP